MDGIQYLINDKGEKTAVLVDLLKHGELWEDFYDHLLIKERANEPRIPFSIVKESLIQEGKLDE